jgi:hypothetical protein
MVSFQPVAQITVTNLIVHILVQDQGFPTPVTGVAVYCQAEKRTAKPKKRTAMPKKKFCL